MIADWTGWVVGQMHIAGISGKQLAEHMGVTPEYVSMILNGKRAPEGAEQRFKSAVAELAELVKETGK